MENQRRELPPGTEVAQGALGKVPIPPVAGPSRNGGIGLHLDRGVLSNCLRLDQTWVVAVVVRLDNLVPVPEKSDCLRGVVGSPQRMSLTYFRISRILDTGADQNHTFLYSYSDARHG